MRKLPGSFTMRKDGQLPRGDWFNFVNEDGQAPKIYIYDEIGFWGTDATEFVKQLNKIDGPQIDLHLNSPGGEIFDGLAIYNSLKQHPANVSVYVDGLAASAASFIAQAGNEVIMARNATLMIHDGIAFAYGNEQDMLDTARILSNLSNNIADIYAQAANARGFTTTLQDFRALMREEVWYTGMEAKDAGLADTVLDTADAEAQAATNKWDLSFYNHAGREHAESPLRVQEKIRLMNRTKEMDMAQGAAEPQPQATEETTPPTPGGDTPPQEPATEPSPAPETPGTDSAPASEPATPPAPEPTPGNSAAGVFQGVMIDGRMVTDQAAIQAYINQTTQAQQEAQVANRRAFVEGLAKANKIPAPQVDSLVALVNGSDGVPAMSDEQFAAFQASYESAAPIALFEQHSATTSTPVTGQPGSGTTPENREERISTLRGIVAMHQRTMSAEQLATMPSYIELQALQSESNES